ncbi:hypothetical protein AB1Y20_003849 [Prymnesium parvum]|uniref:Uncharacterized protein n=1 Tax=Prymnesium parvum TaxID=97485 RepID=A0AB34J514_PRYPA
MGTLSTFSGVTARPLSSFATPIGQQHRVGPMPSKAHMLHPLPFALAPPNPSFTRAQRNKTERPTITGDIWSESGMGLFGIYAHGITETWVVEKALIGLVACSAERHTAVNIKKWTEEALVSIGFRSEDLLGSS